MYKKQAEKDSVTCPGSCSHYVEAVESEPGVGSSLALTHHDAVTLRVR